MKFSGIANDKNYFSASYVYDLKEDNGTYLGEKCINKFFEEEDGEIREIATITGEIMLEEGVTGYIGTGNCRIFV